MIPPRTGPNLRLHHTGEGRSKSSALEKEMQASVARCLRTPPQPAKAKDLDFGLSRCIKQREQPEHSCRWQLYIGPVTTLPSRAKAHPLRPSSILFHPHGRDLPDPGGGAGDCPRVRRVYHDDHLSPLPPL